MILDYLETLATYKINGDILAYFVCLYIFFVGNFTLSKPPDIKAMKQECDTLEEVSRQLFLESVDLHNEQVSK